MRRRSFVFVHGTGVRAETFADTCNTIQRRLDVVPDATLVKCLWGDAHGAQLHAGGKSIPQYDSTKGLNAEVSPEELDAALWQMLLEDPLYELRVLSTAPEAQRTVQFGQLPPGEAVDRLVRSFDPAALEPALSDAGISREAFEAARTGVTADSVYRDALAGTASRPGESRTAIARALVAWATLLELDRGRMPRAAVNPEARDRIAALLTDQLGGTDKGLGKWIGNQLAGLALKAGALDWMRRKRGALTDAAFPATGDILRYQACGDPIRQCIADTVRSATPPIVVLAHSLGGVACVDLMVKEPMPGVELLVTVGSQAPYFYELGALHSLPFGTPLPEHFVKQWLNVYDRRDLLSFIGEGLFPGRVTDVRVDNRLKFPYAHSGYWENEATWKAILERLA
jgi:hypothetical protein